LNRKLDECKPLTSGALYDIFFAAAAAAMKGAEVEAAAAAAGTWLAGFIAGTEAVMQYGGAVAGNRTMLVGQIMMLAGAVFCI
jgi:seryl-tRNA(Sec) selenium transferase